MESEPENLVLRCEKGNRAPVMLQDAFNQKNISNRGFVAKCSSPVQDDICNGTSLTSNNLDENSQYHGGNKQTVTILYPQSSVPLISTNDGELVNLVELPNVTEVDGSLELDSSLRYQGGVVLQHNFDNEGQIAVMTANQANGQLEFLEAHSIQTSSDESITYFKTASVESLNESNTSEGNLLSDQLIHVTASEVVSSGHTIALPLSFVNESGGVSILQGLSHLPITIGDDNQGTISVPVNIQASNLMASSGNETDGQSFILSNISSPIITNQSCNETTISVTSKSQGIAVSTKIQQKLGSSKGLFKFLKSGQVGRPPKVQQNKKVIGYGPTAISAQGVVQEIGNRLVTVLPRPEDLKKLMDNKQLVLTVKGSTNTLRAGNRRKVAFGLPVRKYNSYKPKEQFKKERKNKDIVVNMTLPGGNSASALLVGRSGMVKEDNDEDFIPRASYFRRKTRRRKRGRGRGRGTIVISSTGRRPGRPKKVKTIIEGPNGPRIIQTGPEIPKSTKTIQEEGNAIIVLDKDGDRSNALLGSDIHIKVENSSNALPDSFDLPDIPDARINIVRSDGEQDEPKKRKLPPRNRGVKYKKLIQALKKQEYSDDDFDTDDGNDSEESYSTVLRGTGTLRSLTAPKPKGVSGPGKRGRPRKHLFKESPISIPFSSDLGGTRIIQLSETLKPIHSMNSPSVLIKDEVQPGFEEDSSSLHHKLVITFEQPETGEIVMQHISIQSPGEDVPKDAGGIGVQDANADIFLVPSNEATVEEENATIFVEENGHYEEGFQCSECGEITQYKRDHIRHLRLKHNLRPYECEQCKKTFTSTLSLQHHTLIHDLEKPHRCNHCGKGFNSTSELRQHLVEHVNGPLYDCNHCDKLFSSLSALQSHISYEDVSECRCPKCNKVFSAEDLPTHHSICFDSAKAYVCDICKLQFVSSSGLNRHRKVHNRSSNPGFDEQPSFRCSTCQASFSFESSLYKHVRLVHDELSISLEEDIKPSALFKENSVIEQLQEKLNEGYAPKTSELYDEPDEGETIERSSNDPFKCGICDEPFKDIDVLCDHYASSHMGEQLLYCSLCSVGCAGTQQLEKHKLIHTIEEQQALFVPDSKETPYLCSLCGKGFKTEQECAKHAKVHSQDKQFKCSFCNASFLIKSALDKHLLVHTGQRPYVCDICLKSFRQSAALVRHKLWTHRLKNQNKCEICGKTFFTQSLLLFHLDSHGEEAAEIKVRLRDGENTKETDSLKEEKELLEERLNTNGKKRTCEYCNKECSSLVALLTHKITHKLSASYKCDLCHRTFREKRYLKKHKLTHKGLKTWKCDICKKAFATKLTLIRHSHVHLREALKPDPKSCLLSNEGEDDLSPVSTLPNELKCQDCSLEFVHKSHYVRHKLLHSGIPLLKCGLCDKMFVHKSDIIRHKVMHSFMFTCNICARNFHKRSLYILHMKKHMDSKPFKCDKCGKCFASSGNFKIHQRIHSGEKPYHCNICNYRCSQSGRLLKHKRMHTGEKTATCAACGKHFSNSESLKSHQRVHSGERPFRCGSCQKSFSNSAGLNQHMRDHVKEEMFKCDECSHKFRRSEHLEKHKLFHKMQDQFQKNTDMGLEADCNIECPLYMCDVCGRVFEKKKYLYTHHNVHSRQRLFSCSLCEKHLASRLALKNHLMIHTGEMPHKCSYCEKEFRSLSNLKRHEKVHCGQEMFCAHDMLTCDECGETLYSIEQLNEHKQVHVNLMMMNSEVENVGTGVSQQLYVFDSVDDSMNEAMDPTQQLMVENSQQQFLVDNSQSLLVFPESTNDAYTEIPAHGSEHDKAKVVEPVSPSPPLSPNPEELEHQTQPYILQEKITEASIPTLVQEREVDKPHQCDVCFKYFAKKQYLTKHKYRHREVKPHSCDICGKRFAQKFEVAVHKIKHTGERPYHCEICKKEFRSKVNLVNHRMRHTGEYPYLCSVCNKGLSTQLQLERHVSLHTGAHPFRCDICDKGYFQRLSLIKHLAKGHNIQAVDENYDTPQSLEASENMEVMEAISTIADISEIPEEKHSMVDIMRHKKIKEEVDEVGIEVNDEPMDIATMEELGEGQFAVPEQHEYLLSATQDIDSKFLSSILQQVRVDETDCDMDSAERNDHEDSGTDV